MALGFNLAGNFLKDGHKGWHWFSLAWSIPRPGWLPRKLLVKVFKGKKGHSKLLDTLITGSFNKKVDNPRTPSDWISYNEENVDQFIEDPLSGVPFTIGGYIHELEGMVQMHDVSQYECKNKNLPILFVVGEDDPCTGGTKGLEDSKNTLVKAGYSNIKIKQFSHMRHEILN